MSSVDKAPVVFLEGERVQLCPIRRGDAGLYMRWFNDHQVARYLGIHQPLSREQIENGLEERRSKKVDEEVMLGIWLKDPLRLIGNIGIHDINPRDRHGELGIFIGDSDRWNQGYGTEAIHLLLGYAFDTLNLRKVWLDVRAHNERGLAAYQKIGFEEVARCKEHRYIDGAWRDEIIMELLKNTFVSTTD
jgi:[ribosomal protein S5]-alanine N-acetyltransferase